MLAVIPHIFTTCSNKQSLVSLKLESKPRPNDNNVGYIFDAIIRHLPALRVVDAEFKMHPWRGCHGENRDEIISALKRNYDLESCVFSEVSNNRVSDYMNTERIKRIMERNKIVKTMHRYLVGMTGRRQQDYTALLEWAKTIAHVLEEIATQWRRLHLDE